MIRVAASPVDVAMVPNVSSSGLRGLASTIGRLPWWRGAVARFDTGLTQLGSIPLLPSWRRWIGRGIRRALFGASCTSGMVGVDEAAVSLSDRRPRRWIGRCVMPALALCPGGSGWRSCRRRPASRCCGAICAPGVDTSTGSQVLPGSSIGPHVWRSTSPRQPTYESSV